MKLECPNCKEGLEFRESQLAIVILKPDNVILTEICPKCNTKLAVEEYPPRTFRLRTLNRY